MHSLDSPFIPSALRGIRTVVAESGYDILITHSQESVDKEVANARLLFDSGVAGLLACPTVETKGMQHFARFTDNGNPVIFFGRVGRMCGSGGAMTDDARCGWLATEHLIRQGCRRIALVTSGLKGEACVRQYTGYQQALNRWKLGRSGQLLIMEGVGPEGGAGLAGRVVRMDPMPDGLFFLDDRAAVGCMYALAGEGVRVPEDVAVIGFNNDLTGRMITPGLTTIDYPGFEIGRVAATILLDQLAGFRPAGQRCVTVIPPDLIIRHSSLRSQPDVVSWP